MGLWSIIAVEGYCLYSCMSKKKETYYQYDDIHDLGTKKPTKIEVRINKKYISPAKRPCWCKKGNKNFRPQFSCMAGTEKENKQCPFFGYCEYDAEKDKKCA